MKKIAPVAHIICHDMRLGFLVNMVVEKNQSISSIGSGNLPDPE